MHRIASFCLLLTACCLLAVGCGEKKKDGGDHSPTITDNPKGDQNTNTNTTQPQQSGPQADPNANPNDVVDLSDSDKALLASLPATKFFQGGITDLSQTKKYGSGLIIVTVEEGPGPKPPVGENVNVHYHGQLTNGTKFDSSFDRGQPFSFPLGGGRVIKGWDQGIAELNMGSKALLVVPPHLGYGSNNMGTIPPNSTLLFSVEVMGAF